MIRLLTIEMFACCWKCKKNIGRVKLTVDSGDLGYSNVRKGKKCKGEVTYSMDDSPTHSARVNNVTLPKKSKIRKNYTLNIIKIYMGLKVWVKQLII